MLIRPILALLVLGALLASARAQLPSPYVQAQPPITAGNCAKWYSNFAITDAGKTCGGGSGSFLLLQDAASNLLLEDGSSKLCLESGC